MSVPNPWADRNDVASTSLSNAVCSCLVVLSLMTLLVISLSIPMLSFLIS